MGVQRAGRAVPASPENLHLTRQLLLSEEERLFILISQLSQPPPSFFLKLTSLLNQANGLWNTVDGAYPHQDFFL